MSFFVRGIIISVGLILLWQTTVWFFSLPSYILPSPFLVVEALIHQRGILCHEAIPTLLETVLGLCIGIFFACSIALSMSYFRYLGYWMLPILLISQALPTFAIAPLLVMWFGFGLTSKILTTVLMLFFPITSAFYDGLQRTELGWLQLAQTMHATKWNLYRRIRIPAALPLLASGLRVATAIAPIGAVIGEWVGASHGLGYLMLNANARMQTDLMFAALLCIILFSFCLYFTVDTLLKKYIFW